MIEAARSLFQESGFHQARMAELSERSGVSVGQIYRLFASKSEMIAEIVTADSEARIKRLEHIHAAVISGHSTPHEALRTAAFDALSQGQQALTFEILAEGLRNQSVGRKIGELCDRYRANLREIIRSSGTTVAGDRLKAAEETLLAILFGFGNHALSRPSLNAELLADHAAGMVLAMLK